MNKIMISLFVLGWIAISAAILCVSCCSDEDLDRLFGCTTKLLVEMQD